MPFCMRCGAKLEDGDKFCMRCGTRMDEARPARPRPERSRPAQDPEDEQMKMPVWIPADNKREEIPENDGDSAAESDRIADVPDPNGTFIPAQPVQAPEAAYVPPQPVQTPEAESVPLQPTQNPYAGYVPPQPTQNPYAGYVPPQTAQNAYGNPAQPVWAQQPVYASAYSQPRPQLKSKAGGIVMIVIGAVLLATALVFLLEGVVWAAFGSYVPEELIVFFFVGAFLFLTGGVLLLIFGVRSVRKTVAYNSRAMQGRRY